MRRYTTARWKCVLQTDISRRRLSARAPVFLAAALLLSFLPRAAHAQSQVFPKWVARYDAAHSFDAPAAMAADGRGGTYVTGTACTGATASDPTVCADNEALTIKYDSQGQIVWKAWLSSRGHSATGQQIAVDAAGNAYVLFLMWQVRDQFNSLSSPEVATAKYSASGARQWINFIPSSSSVLYSPGQLAVSPDGGVYITLTSGAPNSVSYDAITIKYGTNGNFLWSRTAAPVPNDTNIPVALQLDAAGNVYALVFSEFNSQIHESIIFRYDASGNLLHYFGGDKLGTIAAFRVDPQGDSYVAGGGSPHAPHGAEANVVAKFNPDGSVGWLHDFGLTSDNPQSSPFVDLAVDRAGNVFVAQTLPGATPTNGGRDISVMKFDSTGQVQWTTRYNGHADDSGFDKAVAVAVNSAGEAYVTGSSSGAAGGPYYEFATVKYDTKGNQLWVQRYAGPGPQGSSPPVALVLSGPDVLVTGSSDGGSTQLDWATIDYVQDAAQLSPTSLNFGDQPIGSQSAAQSITLTNTAEVPLTIFSIDVTGDFNLINNCPSVLAQGATCSLGVTFSPSDLGPRSGTLTVRDDWAGSKTNPQTAQLTGAGTQ